MNGIERITQRIDEEAQAEIDQILSRGEETAAQIAEQYQTQAKRIAAEMAARNQKSAAEQEERLVSVSQMEARKVTLAVKQEMVEQAFQLALEKLCSLPDDAYSSTVAKLLSSAAPDGQGEVIFAPAQRDTIGADAVAKANALIDGGKLTLSDQTRPIRGGFILVNGSVEVNGTFETLMRLQKGQIAGEVAKRLFPGM